MTDGLLPTGVSLVRGGSPLTEGSLFEKRFNTAESRLDIADSSFFNAYMRSHTYLHDDKYVQQPIYFQKTG
jgi:hypothetical protein